MGGDTVEALEHWIVSVSIHAPAWGATCPFFKLLFLSVVSIHAPAWGATVSV